MPGTALMDLTTLWNTNANVPFGITVTLDVARDTYCSVAYAALIGIGVASSAASQMMQFCVTGASIPSCSRSFLNQITSKRTLSCDIQLSHSRHVPVGCNRADHLRARGISSATLKTKSSNGVQPEPFAVIRSQLLLGSHRSLPAGRV